MQDIKPKSRSHSHSHKTPYKLWNQTPPSSQVFFISLLIIAFLGINSLIFYKQITAYFQKISILTRQTTTSISTAKASLQKANFEDTQKELVILQNIVSTILEEHYFLRSSFQGSDQIFESLSQVATLTSQLSTTALQIKDMPNIFLEANRSYSLNPESTSDAHKNIAQDFTTSLDQLLSLINNLNTLYNSLANFNTTLLPDGIQLKFTEFLNSLENSLDKLQLLHSHLELISDLLGLKIPHTYLILIQNNHELRPTGGFIGSLAFAELNKGLLTEFKFQDIYDFDGILTKTPPTLPPEFHGLNSKLWIRDANYTPDFSISAQRIETMLQRAKAPSFDTIIAIDQTFIQNILTEIKSVSLPSYSAPITAQNYFTVLTYLVEANKEHSSEHKKILSEFLNSFQSKLLAELNIASLVRLTTQGLSQKNIQLFSKKSHLQTFFNTLNLTNKFLGTTLPSNTDYLYITNSSIGGNKTDRYLKERYIHNTQFNLNNTVTNHLTIRKYHSFQNSQEYLWQQQLKPFGVTQLQDFTRYILGRGDNISMVKIYLPQNTRLLSHSATPFKPKYLYDSDLKAHYLLVKMHTKPGQISEFQLTYQPRLNLTSKHPSLNSYNFLVQPQAGLTPILDKTYSLENPTQQAIFSHFPPLPTTNFSFSKPLTKNQLFKVLYQAN